jgi:hypothetical protein
MSDQPITPEATETAATGTETDSAETKPTETVDFWKAKAREQEKRAKDNAQAAKRLAEIEESQKSDAQKAADAQAQAEERHKVAESKALSLTIATEHKLGPEDAALLAALPDEDSMRALATRLAGQAAEQKKQGNRVLKEGTSTSTSPTGDDEKRELVRGLFASETD